MYDTQGLKRALEAVRSDTYLVEETYYMLKYELELSCSIMYVCMATHIARAWINRVRLPVLHVVS